ncbi:MAG TPA: guanylate kinase [Actinomycetota bacterium]
MSGPSGAGKTTLVSALCANRPEVVLSVSATTRPRRHDEVEGLSYLFVGEEDFAALEAGGGFLESAIVHGHRYGTPRAPVEDALAAGKAVVLEIDVQGARQVKAALPEAVLVFVEPPSMEVLRSRLAARGSEDAAALALRVRNAEQEMAAAGEFDHRIVNDRLGDALAELFRILDEPGTAEHPARSTR